MALQVRAITVEEKGRVERLARSRTEPARLVERARIVLAASQGKRVPAIARQLTLSEKAVRLWLKRFNTQGLDGLNDEPRRPARHLHRRAGERSDRGGPDQTGRAGPAVWKLDARSVGGVSGRGERDSDQAHAD